MTLIEIFINDIIPETQIKEIEIDNKDISNGFNCLKTQSNVREAIRNANGINKKRSYSTNSM